MKDHTCIYLTPAEALKLAGELTALAAKVTERQKVHPDAHAYHHVTASLHVNRDIGIRLGDL